MPRRLKKSINKSILERMEQTKCIYLAHPHGMCAGVRRALQAVDAVLERFGPPVYVLHEIVHNSFIVNGLRKRGVRFAESLDEVPPGSVLLFSAHGVSSARGTGGAPQGAQDDRRDLSAREKTAPCGGKGGRRPDPARSPGPSGGGGNGRAVGCRADLHSRQPGRARRAARTFRPERESCSWRRPR